MWEGERDNGVYFEGSGLEARDEEDERGSEEAEGVGEREGREDKRDGGRRNGWEELRERVGVNGD